jgi:hypothetical protein
MAIISDHIVDQRNSNTDMQYSYFSDIPESRHDEASLIGWICQTGSLKEIPKPLWTEGLLEAAAYWDSKALASIRRSDTMDFGKLVDLALSSNANRTSLIKPEDYTEDFLIKICCDHPRCMADINWYGGVYDLLTDKAITEIASASITGMLNLINHRPVNDELVTTEVVRSAIKNQPSAIEKLAEYDQYHPIIVDLVDDYWPEFSPMYLSSFEGAGLDASVRPSTVDQALKCLLVSPDKSIDIFYKVCISKYSTEDVIQAALDMHGGLNKLFDIYSNEQLQPHTKKYRALRGKILEDELGM